ncbi:MAG: hypothetical protein B6D72_12460 [gamma proteobacterium symbiont of Ctena orbiculata]|nr:MAG: hypothetical protein DBP00_18120 [gamma proteobacterium symbiont of Ctena orbiculata]PVV10401.1 MAG: hypothetical protein B6D72_12460 [gamma proteobacterium symbiont of Ctena orbiculata]PVV11548.1 MAG: hypothetical protein B6D82_11135 [gamma proteobacterium symbiont of Ctena orbiculata]PVV20272.1 MAG: hypothetical protein B6D74_13365 [gamma proteobacterium symbiont of Ctena orbiculata]
MTTHNLFILRIKEVEFNRKRSASEPTGVIAGKLHENLQLYFLPGQIQQSKMTGKTMKIGIKMNLTGRLFQSNPNLPYVDSRHIARFVFVQCACYPAEFRGFAGSLHD